MNIKDAIDNAKPGSYIDIRTKDNQVDSFPIEALRKEMGNKSFPTDPMPWMHPSKAKNVKAVRDLLK